MVLPSRDPRGAPPPGWPNGTYLSSACVSLSLEAAPVLLASTAPLGVHWEVIESAMSEPRQNILMTHACTGCAGTYSGGSGSWLAPGVVILEQL